MDIHVEKACAGLRELASRKVREPDFLLYIGVEDADVIPKTISGIPVILTPAYFGCIDFGTYCNVLYIPCYTNENIQYYFAQYKNAYEDYC